MATSSAQIMSASGEVPLDAVLDGRLPGGRFTFSRQFRANLSWHVSGLRLALRNIAVTAGMAGVGPTLRRGRFMIRPFVEAGFARVVSQYDVGGYFADDGTSGNRYVPVWRREQTSGAGIGGGVGLEVTLAPRVILEVLGASWSLSAPDNAPQLPNVFLGAGLRWAL